MRRRNKPKVVWLPVTNTFSLPGDVSTLQTTVLPLNGSSAGDEAVMEIPVVQDGSASDPLDPNSSLSDIENSGYRLRRIVGKVWCFIGQTGTAPLGFFQVTAGFMVRKVNANNAENGVSMASVAGSGNISTNRIQTSGDPWIWRRSWILGNNGTTGYALNGTPSQNFGAQYPGPTEGPHVDQKTARIVGPDDRLYLDFSVVNIFDQDTPTSLVVITDLRVLASMRTSIGNRRNATR